MDHSKPMIIQMGLVNSMGHRTKQKVMHIGKRFERRKGSWQNWDRNEREVGRVDRTHMHDTAREQNLLMNKA